MRMPRLDSEGTKLELVAKNKIITAEDAEGTFRWALPTDGLENQL